MNQMNQAQTYDDTVQNFQISDDVLIIPLSYETEYGACFASGTKGTVKMISEPDMVPARLGLIGFTLMNMGMVNFTWHLN